MQQWSENKQAYPNEETEAHLLRKHPIHTPRSWQILTHSMKANSSHSPRTRSRKLRERVDDGSHSYKQLVFLARALFTTSLTITISRVTWRCSRWMDGCTDGCTDIWIDGRMYGWMSACMDGCMDECMIGWVDGCMDVWIDLGMYVCLDISMYELMGGWMYGCMDVWMYGWTYGCRDLHSVLQKVFRLSTPPFELV